MQYYPPCVTPNGGQTYPCNPFPAAPASWAPGSVAALSLADGGVQLYFVPACPCPPWGNPAWYPRNAPNQFPVYQPAPSQQFPRIASPSCLQNNDDDYENKPGYQLKFHNDNWTSTTDLHYFSPPLHNWFPKRCASSQTEQPYASAPVEAFVWPKKVCACACACYKRDEYKKKQDSGCKSSCSSMSIELEGNPVACCRAKKKTWSARKIQISDKPSVKCDDMEPEIRKSDKAITTYSEKMVGGCADNGRETQTSCTPNTSIRRAASFFGADSCSPELWQPSSPRSRRALRARAPASDSDAADRN